MDKPKTQAMIVLLPVELHRDLKKRAADEYTSITDLVIRALCEQYGFKEVDDEPMDK